jgi:hypothetical protein
VGVHAKKTAPQERDDLVMSPMGEGACKIWRSLKSATETWKWLARASSREGEEPQKGRRFPQGKRCRVLRSAILRRGTAAASPLRPRLEEGPGSRSKAEKGRALEGGEAKRASAAGQT